MAEGHTTVEYRDIKGFPGYRVGSDGSVWSCIKVGPKRELGTEWKRVRDRPGVYKYRRVNLYLNGKEVEHYVHRLVAAHFLGPRPEGMECCHNDGDRVNNHVDNLRWDTHANNNRDMAKHGTRACGERHGRSKLSEEAARLIRAKLDAGCRLIDIKNEFGVSIGQASRIRLRQNWKHL